MAEPTPQFRAALAHRYRIQHVIGIGASATVYFARDLRDGRDVAIKVLDHNYGSSVSPERFLDEIATTARLRHPNILPLLDSGEAAGELYLVTPFVVGETLRVRMERDGVLPVRDTVRITREVAEALQHAHDEGVVHRDVKPENVILAGNRAMLMDFGVARSLIAMPTDRRHTHTGTIVGTAQYMSPEQAGGDKSITPAADQFSLACVVFEMFTGHLPFKGPTVQAVLLNRLTTPPTPMRALRPPLPAELESSVTRALALAPDERFPRVIDFALAVDKGTAS